MTFPASLPSWILPAFLTDAVNGFILVPAILLIAGRIVLTLETRTILMITGLLIASILATAGSITWAVLDDLVSHGPWCKTLHCRHRLRRPAGDRICRCGRFCPKDDRAAGGAGTAPKP